LEWLFRSRGLHELADPEYTFFETVRTRRLSHDPRRAASARGSPIGLFVLHHAAVRPFTDKQIELVETFADQTVIAIENTRLFDEMQKRTDAQLSRSCRNALSHFSM
jgi:two-component system NtrC family sensor kinase